MTVSALDALLGRVWLGVGSHLWQTTLVLGLIFVLARLVETAPARFADLLWRGAFAKVFLPLPLLGLAGARLGGLLLPASASLDAPAGATSVVALHLTGLQATGLQTIQVLLDPTSLAVSNAPRGGSPIPPFFLLLTVVWLAGAAWICWRALRESRRARPTNARPLVESQEAVRSRIHESLAGTAIPESRVLVVPSAVMPSARGLFGRRILIPERLVAELEMEELRSILLHEQEHLRRGDPLLALLQTVALALFFYYPPLWLLLARMRTSAECACDERAMKAGSSPALYARALARTVSLGLSTSTSFAAAGARPSVLARRFRRIEEAGRRTASSWHALVVAAGLAAVAVTSFTPLSPLAGLDEAAVALPMAPSAAAPGNPAPSGERAHPIDVDVPATGVTAEELGLKSGQWIGVRVLVTVYEDGKVLTADAGTPALYGLGSGNPHERDIAPAGASAIELSGRVAIRLRDAAVRGLLGARFKPAGSAGIGGGDTSGSVARGEVDLVWEVPEWGDLPSGTAILKREAERDLVLLPIPEIVDGSVTPPELVERVQPTYPEDARRQGVGGKVVLEAVIDCWRSSRTALF